MDRGGGAGQPFSLVAIRWGGGGGGVEGLLKKKRIEIDIWKERANKDTSAYMSSDTG